jgi:predicted permease
VTADVVYKLLAIMATVALGWLAGRAGWLNGPGRNDDGNQSGEPPGAAALQALSSAAFYLFVPALLFRTMSRLDLGSLPGPTLAAYFVPATAFALVVYAWQRHRLPQRGEASPTAPATRTVTALYGNAVQLGIPMAAAIFGEAGLALHIALVSLHALVLLTLLTVLAESDLARASAGQTRWQTLRSTVRNALIHPVVLPVLAGLAWNLTGWGLHPALDQALLGLGSAVVPVCLVLIGLSLASYGVRGGVRGALGLVALKLLALPAVVGGVAHWGFGLGGLPLQVLVMMAALPVGNNALIFAQRYGTRQAEATLAIVLSTSLFGLSAGFWLWLLRSSGV